MSRVYIRNIAHEVRYSNPEAQRAGERNHFGREAVELRHDIFSVNPQIDTQYTSGTNGPPKNERGERRNRWNAVHQSAGLRSGHQTLLDTASRDTGLSIASPRKSHLGGRDTSQGLNMVVF